MNWIRKTAGGVAILSLLAVCGCTYEHHDEIVDATRDSKMQEWLDKYNLRISFCSDNCSSTAIYVERKKVKDGE